MPWKQVFVHGVVRARDMTLKSTCVVSEPVRNEVKEDEGP